MRIVIDVPVIDVGRFEGELSVDGSSPICFAGWLDLIRVLEAVTTADRAAVPTDGAER